MKIFNKNLQAGFTIVELMIATSVFSTVLLVGLAGFVQIGKSYYKGINITQTGETAKQTLAEISSNVRLSGGSVGSGTSVAGPSYYCIGSHRYTYILYNRVDTSVPPDFSTNFGLLEDNLPGNNGCGDPFGGPSQVPLNNPTELLGNQMRLLEFNVAATDATQTLYKVDITVAYGQDSALTSPINSSTQCKLQLGGNEFCAITRLTTMIHRDVGT